MLKERADGAEPTLADIGEDELLSTIFPLLPGGPGVLIGPGDDTAFLSARDGSVLATTDAMVRGRDWLDEWSTGADVGAKLVAQNLADIAAMGGISTALLVTVVADPRTSLAWVRDLTQGLAHAASQAGVPVVGGGPSAAPTGVWGVSASARRPSSPGRYGTRLSWTRWGRAGRELVGEVVTRRPVTPPNHLENGPLGGPVAHTTGPASATHRPPPRLRWPRPRPAPGDPPVPPPVHCSRPPRPRRTAGDTAISPCYHRKNESPWRDGGASRPPFGSTPVSAGAAAI